MISVIVTFHNIGWLIGRCLESLSIQTYQEYEVILVDNGSTDKSKKVVDEVKKGIKKLHYYYIDHQDVNSAINYGIDRASGEYLFFLNGCDFLNQNALHFLYWGLISSGSDIMIGDYDEVGYLTKKANITQAPEDICVKKYNAKQMLLRMNTPAMHPDIRLNRLWNKLYKSNLFNGVHLSKGSGAEVKTIWDIVSKCNRIGSEFFVTYFRAESPESVQCDMSLAEAYEERLKYYESNYDEVTVNHTYFLLITNLLYIYKSNKDTEIKEKCIYRINQIIEEHPNIYINRNKERYIQKISKKYLDNLDKKCYHTIKQVTN